MAKDKKSGMEYEDTPVTKTKNAGKKLAVANAKELRIGTLLTIIGGKMAAAFGVMLAWMGKHLWKFTKKHKFALVVVYATLATLVNLMPFLPELVKSTVIGAL